MHRQNVGMDSWVNRLLWFYSLCNVLLQEVVARGQSPLCLGPLPREIFWEEQCSLFTENVFISNRWLEILHCRLGSMQQTCQLIRVLEICTLYKQPNGKTYRALELDVSVPMFIIISVLPYLKVGSVYNIICSSQHTPKEMWCEFELTVAGTFVKGTKASLLQSCSINVFLVFNWLTLHWINEYIRTQSDWIRCCSKHGSPPSHLNEGCASRHHVAVAKHVRWRSDQQLEWVKTQWSVNYESAFGECQIKGLLIAELNAKGGTQQTFLSSVIT